MVGPLAKGLTEDCELTIEQQAASAGGRSTRLWLRKGRLPGFPSSLRMVVGLGFRPFIERQHHPSP